MPEGTDKRTIQPAKRLKGEITLPGDKSISHRAIILGSIAKGTTRITNLLNGEDCKATQNAFSAMGVGIRPDGNSLLIEGDGPAALKPPKENLFLGNSGTTMRLVAGILAAQPFEAMLEGDPSLSARPMKRIIEPLRLMGADITALSAGDRPPLKIKGAPLESIDYKTNIPSAQVKSAILLAGLYARGTTKVTEPLKSRDHTERIFGQFGVKVGVDGLTIAIEGGQVPKAKEVFIPGDISAAAFFIVAALLIKGSHIEIRDVGCNPTRTGFIDALKSIGAKIKMKARRSDFEPLCDMEVEGCRLAGDLTIEGDLLVRSIDEIPILMIAASLNKGKTIIKGAGELRVKETDRISSMVENLKAMGADLKVDGDGVIIEGVESLTSARLKSFGDHRTAMAMTIAALTAKDESILSGTACINTSFPQFSHILTSISL